MELLMPISFPLVIAHGTKLWARLFYGFAAVVMVTASIHTLSRGGMISLVAEILFIALLSARLMQDRRSGDSMAWMRGKVLRLFTPRRGAVALIALIVTIGIISTGASPVIRRVGETVREMRSTDPQADVTTGRMLIWKGALAMIEANPFFGVGLGAFQTAYPVYKQGDILNSDDSLFIVAQAHNDYLQVMADCGIAGATIALWFLVLVFGQIKHGIKSPDRWLSSLALGCGASIFGILVHSLFDFNLQLPSHALLFLLLLAVVSRVAAKADDERHVTGDGIGLPTGA
jgi:O-antigen ligase